MKRYQQGSFIPSNPGKYVGKTPIMFRSSWERKVMETFDKNPNIIAWASESIRIPYVNPFTGKATVYIPDFLVTYHNKSGTQVSEIIEVKPRKETHLSEAKGNSAKMALALNQYKWAAARAFAAKNGLGFRVMTEDNIYNNPVRKRR